MSIHCLSKVVELKKELQERGLSITGNKSDLIFRLEEYLLKHGMVESLKSFIILIT
jgi:hypothetical protein